MERRDYTKTNIINFDRAKYDLNKNKKEIKTETETIDNQESKRKLFTSEFISKTVERLTKAFSNVPVEVTVCILYQVIENFVDNTDDR